jgi:NhaP-type Na+/H+ or K+/H+ antiporter
MKCVHLFVLFPAHRLLTIILVSPILMHSSYEYDWRWGFVIAWSGIRGVFSLLLAPDIYNISRFKLPAPHMVGKIIIRYDYFYLLIITYFVAHCTQS